MDADQIQRDMTLGCAIWTAAVAATAVLVTVVAVLLVGKATG